MLRSLLPALLAALALCACERSPGALPPPAALAPATAPVPSESPGVTAAPSSPAGPADAGPGPAPITRAVSQVGELDRPLERAGESLVDPSARFAVEVAAPLDDARLSLFDAQEALVPCESSAEVSSTATRITLVPARPLRPGSRHTLRLEGSSAKELRDLAGKAYLPVSLSLLVAGDPPAEPAQNGKGKKRRRR